MTIHTFLIAGFILLANVLSAQPLKPYTLGAISDKPVSETAALVKKALEENGFELLGEYMPADDPDRWLIVFSSEELLKAAASGDELAGFASALRIGLTSSGARVNVSYTTPEYWLNAYYRDDYESL